ncbi:hypothetical protein [Leisingera methylohalidivorans]|uniref:Uncharacterized protein n=1 Tax=Leisingera methylohalidivorans DSM 14336 TaxID=999552 RepID=V9VPA4_9RHOB|nr:hypothetical protein [Leisingera methylohalidivorans]AHC99812.1 hypothetical protein METH_02955 [Leisingera methylohalidivorans DSM 14336]
MMRCFRAPLSVLGPGSKARQLAAHELGGRDYISLSLYRLAAGLRLKPCGLPEDKAFRFVLALNLTE